MNDTASSSLMTDTLSGEDWMRLACAFWSSQLANLLVDIPKQEDGQAAQGVRFLMSHSCSELECLGWDKMPETEQAIHKLLHPETPMGRLTHAYGWTDMDIGLVVLAGLPEIHEGFADLLRMVNPEQRCRTATGLATQLLCTDGNRRLCTQSLVGGGAVGSGVLRLHGEGPLFSRHLLLADGLWPVLHDLEAWPATVTPSPSCGVAWGLRDWLDEQDCADAISCIRENKPAQVRVQAANTASAVNRSMVLAEHTGLNAFAFHVNEKTPRESYQDIFVHCTARGSIPILVLDSGDSEQRKSLRVPVRFPGTMIVACTYRDGCEVPGTPLLSIHVDGVDADACTEIWRSALPTLGASASGLAARFPVEPHEAAEIVEDLCCRRQVTAAAVGQQIRARAGSSQRAGINLVIPRADWDQLVLPPEQSQQLEEAIGRLHHQARVLDQWGFLKSRGGSRGVRLLLTGPPGTGKTLSAEVMAHALGVDLLIVDISRVVSKWIGETEKNLEQAFDAAERSRAVLLFDEADALFGKRTEVSDSHDRYANLETAYLLTRLERFEGLVVMTTNMRHNIDPAFMRRMEYIVDFDEPGRAEREAIWRSHVPEVAPLHADVELAELAAMFPVVGGVIRNAAAAAAFRASAAERDICRDDFIHCLRREYEKQGKAFPAPRQPPDLSVNLQGGLS